MMLRKSDAQFVMDVAILVWGERQLKKRCLDAKRANKYANEDKHRKELTPTEYDMVKDCLHYKLTYNNITGTRRRNRMSKIWLHMPRAIYTLRRNPDPVE